MLSSLRTPMTAAAALTRPDAIRRADEGRSADLRAANASASCVWRDRGHGKSFGGNIFGNKPEPCRMPSASLTLDPSSYQQEGDR